MKTLKRIAVSFVLVAGLGMALTSCSDDMYYEDPNVEPPIEASPHLPPVLDPR